MTEEEASQLRKENAHCLGTRDLRSYLLAANMGILPELLLKAGGVS